MHSPCIFMCSAHLFIYLFIYIFFRVGWYISLKCKIIQSNCKTKNGLKYIYKSTRTKLKLSRNNILLNEPKSIKTVASNGTYRK